MNVIQVGSREQYNAALAFMQLGVMDGLYTDFWCKSFLRKLLNIVPISAAKRGFGRCNPEIPDSKVFSLNYKSFLHFRSLRSASTNEYDNYVRQGEYFTRSVSDMIDYSSSTNVYAYTNNAKEIFERVGNSGIKILNQIEPGPTEWELVNAERKLWKDWEICNEIDYSSYADRVSKEWMLADSIVVNSGWSSACVAQYFPEKKIVRIPLSANGSISLRRMHELNSLKNIKYIPRSEIRVLFLGQVCLRKGFQYLWEAAQLLNNFNVTFNVVGPWYLAPSILKMLPSNMNYHGSVPYSQVDQFYLDNDIFVFPTLSDGFGLTQIEALKYGLPIIATDRCGEVVVDGVNGFCIKPSSVQDLVDKLLLYIENKDLLYYHSVAALRRHEDFSFKNYVLNMSSLIGANCGN